jgi:hypothetical protein
VNDQRARDAVEHLQAAAIEVIASLRAFLDIAEDLVRDPSPVAATLDDFVAKGRAVVVAMGDAVGGDANGAAAAGEPTTDPGVTRIRVS